MRAEIRKCETEIASLSEETEVDTIVWVADSNTKSKKKKKARLSGVRRGCTFGDHKTDILRIPGRTCIFPKR